MLLPSYNSTNIIKLIEYDGFEVMDMERKKHVEEMLNTMINDVNYIKLSTYQIKGSEKRSNV